MYRPFLTACAAVAFTCTFIGSASAADRPPTDPTSVGISSEGSQGFTSADAVPMRATRAALERTPATPTVDADLHMWTAPTGRSSTAIVVHRGDPIHRFARGIVSRTSSIAMTLTRDAMRYIGTPYVFGGTSASGFDCSGYVQHVFGMLGIALPRTADAQYYAGRATRGGMVVGDLVFFQTYLPGPSHVGIYLGGGRFIHSSGHGVMISRIADSYWSSRYLGAKRVSSKLAIR